MATLTDKDYVERRTKELGYTPRVNAIMSKSILKNIRNKVDEFLSEEGTCEVYKDTQPSITDTICSIICREIRFDPDVRYYGSKQLSANKKYAQSLAAEFNVSLHEAQRGRKHCERITSEKS